MSNAALQKEPLLTVGAIGSVIGAGIVMLQSFGVPITDAQSDALTTFVAIAAPLVIGLIGRGMVFSPDSAEQLAADQYAAGAPPTEPVAPVPPPADREDVVTEALDQLERASKPVREG
jgi:hypothetical protein